MLASGAGGPASPLHAAVATGKGNDVVRTLMQSGAHRGREWVEAQDKRGRTALHRAVAGSSSYSEETQYDVAHSLLSAVPAVACAADRYGMTPLHNAVNSSCCLRVVARLAHGPHGAQACAVASRTFRTTPLHIAVGRRATAGAPRTGSGGVDERFFSVVRAHGRVDGFERALAALKQEVAAAGGLFRQSPEYRLANALLGRAGDTHYALRCSALAMQDVRGCTPLHHAVAYNAPVDALQLLLSAARRFDAQCIAQVDEAGRTVLHVAAASESVSLDAVKMLLAYRPSSDWLALRDAHGKSAQQLAQKNLAEHPSSARTLDVMEAIKAAARTVVSAGSNFVAAIGRRGSAAVTATQLAKLMTPRSGGAGAGTGTHGRIFESSFTASSTMVEDDGVALEKLKLRSAIKARGAAGEANVPSLKHTGELISWGARGGALDATTGRPRKSALSRAAQEALRQEVAAGPVGGASGRLGKRGFGLRSRVAIQADLASAWEEAGDEGESAAYGRAVTGRASSLARWQPLAVEYE